ncbi:MAG: hypothetical protein KGZ39_05745 [Simkania sp.]|nr:hypothetical protein [Simkania sp.]
MTIHNWYEKKGFCTSVLDIPVRSKEAAEEIEELLKDPEATFERKFFSDEIEVKDGLDPMQALLTASTTDIDRDGEVVLVDGIKRGQFNKNPVIAWAHDYSRPPIGRALWNKLDGNALKALVQFAKQPADWQGNWFPAEIFALTQQKVIRGVSIGFITTKQGPPTEKEITLRPELASVRRVIRESTLLEISLCTVQSNPTALVESVSKGIFGPDIYQTLGLEEPEDESFWSWTAEECGMTPKVVQVSKSDILRKILKK